MDEYVERSDRPHQGIFEAELIPKILADTPALDVGDEEKNQDDRGNRPREQSECKQRPADKLGERDRARPELSRPIAALIELDGEVFQVERAHAGIGKEPEGVAQAVRHQRETDRDAQQRVGEW